ncbi:MAG: hypothetical protein EAX96_16735 [Candidatus Lokiarchaeota archaeon]|nr:hypothetical protein [Candidatus Lokiarchaeota archaeon]
MELKDEFFQYISQVLSELKTSIKDLKAIGEIKASFQCKRVIFSYLFLIYLGKEELISYPGEIFNFERNLFKKNELDDIIKHFIFDCGEKYSKIFKNFEQFSYYINELQQHFMIYSSLGSVYTPLEIVKYMVKKIIENYSKTIDFNQLNDDMKTLNTIKSLKILDPSMGTGIFLIEMLNQLTNFIYNKINDKKKFNKRVLKKTILEYCLYGVELDFISLEIARFFLLIDFNNDYEPLECIKTNFIQSNTLIDPLFSNRINEFSIIMGNPPYIRSDTLIKSQPELSKIYKNEFKEVIKTGQKSDIYFYFIKKSIEMLKTEGFLSFIVPNRFLTNIYAEKLREYMLKNLDLIEIIDFSEYQDDSLNRVFKNIEVFPSIFLAKKSIYSKNIIMKQPRKREELNEQGTVISQQKIIDFDNLIVISNDEKKISILNKLLDKRKFVKLGLLVKVGEGLRGTTISKKEYEKLNPIEKKLYVREIRGKNIRKFHLNNFNGYYKLKKDREFHQNVLKKIENKNAIDIKLSNETEQFLKKIVLSEMGSELRATLTESQEFSYGGTYFITEIRSRIDLNLLLGLLNSSMTKLLFNLMFKSGKWGNSYKFRAQYIEKIPFPIINPENTKIIDQIKQKVNEILDLQEKIISIEEKKTNSLIQNKLMELDELLFRFYEIPFEYLKELGE